MQLSPRERCRTCVGCRSRDRRSALLKLVAVEIGGSWAAVPDPSGRQQGRGAWVHPDRRCFELAQRRSAWSRALRRQVVAPDPLHWDDRT